MDRGFLHYFGAGMRTAWRVVLKGGRFFRYYLYFFASLIGRCIPFFGAVFPVADVRKAKIAKKEGDIAVIRSFEGIESGNKFGSAVLALSIELLIILGGLAVIGAFGYGFAVLGRIIGLLADMRDPDVLAIVFAVPFIAAAVGYFIAAAVMFAPTAYVVDSHKKVTATGVMGSAVETMKRAGKITCFLNTAVPLMIKAAYLTLAWLVFELLSGITSIDPIAVVLLCVLWLIVALAVYVVFAPVFTMAADIANTSLFEDIALDPEALDMRAKGIFVKRAEVNTLENKGLDSNLNRLFDEEEEKSFSSPDTKYVPPTDYEPKMTDYKEKTETDTQDKAAEESEKPREYVIPSESEEPAAEEKAEEKTEAKTEEVQAEPAFESVQENVAAAQTETAEDSVDDL